MQGCGGEAEYGHKSPQSVVTAVNEITDGTRTQTRTLHHRGTPSRRPKTRPNPRCSWPGRGSGSGWWKPSGIFSRQGAVNLTSIMRAANRTMKDAGGRAAQSAPAGSAMTALSFTRGLPTSTITAEVARREVPYGPAALPRCRILPRLHRAGTSGGSATRRGQSVAGSGTWSC